jgi:hypothetical protein
MHTVHCDGCGIPAAEDHIARRIQRLEWATRFRPIHIHVLFIAEAPPPRLENYYYYPAKERNQRTGLSRVLFDELMRGLGILREAEKDDESCLTEFQKRNYFFADALECPVEEILAHSTDRRTEGSPVALSHRFGPTVARRIKFSYKPRAVALLSTRTRHLIPFLRDAGLGDLLRLHQGLPLHFPHPDNPAAQGDFRRGLEKIFSSLQAAQGCSTSRRSS